MQMILYDAIRSAAYMSSIRMPSVPQLLLRLDNSYL